MVKQILLAEELCWKSFLFKFLMNNSRWDDAEAERGAN